MSKIRDYIENNILEKWKSYPKWSKISVVMLITIVIATMSVPFLYPKYIEWKTNIESIFNCPKQILPDTIAVIPKDTIINYTILQIGKTPIKDTLILQKKQAEEIKGEGTETDFTEEEARKKALETAEKDLLRKFTKDKEIVIRYAKIAKDTTTKTNNGMWKVHIVISVNESHIK